VTVDHIRVGRVALAWALGGRTVRAAVQAHVEREAALVRLADVTPPAVFEPVVQPEVARRTAVLGSELAAIESVYQDLICGRWTPTEGTGT
jgi:hypothetical protein